MILAGAPRAKPLYYLELFENDRRQERIPVYNTEVTIGRWWPALLLISR